jgi:hypothetical protein
MSFCVNVCVLVKRWGRRCCWPWVCVNVTVTHARHTCVRRHLGVIDPFFHLCCFMHAYVRTHTNIAHIYMHGKQIQHLGARRLPGF